MSVRIPSSLFKFKDRGGHANRGKGKGGGEAVMKITFRLYTSIHMRSVHNCLFLHFVVVCVAVSGVFRLPFFRLVRAWPCERDRECTAKKWTREILGWRTFRASSRPQDFFRRTYEDEGLLVVRPVTFHRPWNGPYCLFKTRKKATCNSEKLGLFFNLKNLAACVSVSCISSSGPQHQLLYLTTQIRFPIWGGRVTCLWSKFANSLGRTNLTTP